MKQKLLRTSKGLLEWLLLECMRNLHPGGVLWSYRAKVTMLRSWPAQYEIPLCLYGKQRHSAMYLPSSVHSIPQDTRKARFQLLLHLGGTRRLVLANRGSGEVTQVTSISWIFCSLPRLCRRQSHRWKGPGSWSENLEGIQLEEPPSQPQNRNKGALLSHRNFRALWWW